MENTPTPEHPITAAVRLTRLAGDVHDLAAGLIIDALRENREAIVQLPEAVQADLLHLLVASTATGTVTGLLRATGKADLSPINGASLALTTAAAAYAESLDTLNKAGGRRAASIRILLEFPDEGDPLDIVDFTETKTDVSIHPMLAQNRDGQACRLVVVEI